MHNTACLNCETPIAGKFCHECGQKAGTHQLTAHHFIMHDLVHGTFHLDKGMLFTLKELFIRPGYAAKDYIDGKRIRYYNIFYMLLLVVGFIFLLIYNKETVEGIQSGSGPVKNIGLHIMKILKIVLFMGVPILAVAGMVVYQKLNYNFIEHNIISGFAILGTYIIFLIILLLLNLNLEVFDSVSGLVGFFALFYPVYVYYQLAKKYYKTYQIILLSLAQYIIAFFVICFLAGIYIAVQSSTL